MDYGTLAGLSNPGPAPAGMNWEQVRRYQTLNNLSQESLQNAVPLAELNARKQTMDQEVYAAGQPGRMDQATLANMNAQSDVERQPSEAQYKDFKTQNLTDDEKKKAADLLKPIQEYADAYDAADTPEKKQQVMDTYRSANLPPLPNGYKPGSHQKIDEALFYTSRQVRENAPGLALKRDIAHESAITKAAVARDNAKSAMERTQAVIAGRAALSKAVTEARAAIAAGKQPNIGQLAALLVEAKYGDDTDGALTAIQLLNGGGSALNAQQKVDIANKLGINLPTNVEAPALPTSNRTGPGPGAKATTTVTKPAVPGALPVSSAKTKLESFKGTANEAAAIEHFVNTYPGEPLPDWAKKK